MHCDGHIQIPWQLLVKINEMAMMDIARFPHQNHWNMTCESYGPSQLQLLIRIIETWAMTAMGHLLYNFLSKSLKYDLWQRWTISITIPYQNHRNMSYDCYGPSPLQFLIKIIEIWSMAAMGHFHYNSLSKSSKYYPCWTYLDPIAIPY